MSAPHVSVAARESGPVVILAGEADLTAVTQLSEALATQLSGRTSHLTIDASNLHFADSVSIRALMVAATILKDRGGSLVLWHPQPQVAQTLSLLGIDRMFTNRGQPQSGANPDDGPDRQRLGQPGREHAPSIGDSRGIRAADRAVRDCGCHHRGNTDRGAFPPASRRHTAPAD